MIQHVEPIIVQGLRYLAASMQDTHPIFGLTHASYARFIFEQSKSHPNFLKKAGQSQAFWSKKILGKMPLESVIGIAPPGMEKLVRRFKRNPKIANPWALAWKVHRLKEERKLNLTAQPFTKPGVRLLTERLRMMSQGRPIRGDIMDDMGMSKWTPEMLAHWRKVRGIPPQGWPKRRRRHSVMGRMNLDIGPAQVDQGRTASARDAARKRLLKAMIDWHGAEHGGSVMGLPILDTGTSDFKVDPFKAGGETMDVLGRREGYLPGGGRFRRKTYEPGGGWFFNEHGQLSRHRPPNVRGAFPLSVPGSLREAGTRFLRHAAYPFAGHEEIDPFKMGYTNIDPFKMGYTNIDPFKMGYTNIDPFKMGVTAPDPFKMGIQPVDPFKMGYKTPYWIPGGGNYEGSSYNPGGGYHVLHEGRKRFYHHSPGDTFRRGPGGKYYMMTGDQYSFAMGAKGPGWQARRKRQKLIALRLCRAAKAGNPKAILILKRITAKAQAGDRRAKRLLRDCAQMSVLHAHTKHKFALPPGAPVTHEAHTTGISAMVGIARTQGF